MKNLPFQKIFKRSGARLALLVQVLLLSACAVDLQPVAFASQPTPTAPLPPASVATSTASHTPLPGSTSPNNLSDLRPLSQAPAQEAFLSGAALVEALRAGGYVMYIQSVESDQTQSNANIQNLQNCPSQSTLSEQDQINAQTIGTAILALGIPAGQVLYSASCSSHDTAMLAFGLGENWADLIESTTLLRGERITALRQFLSTRPQSGVNNVFIGHGLDITDVTGLTFAEGETAIYKPLGKTGYSLVARVLPPAWDELKRDTGSLVQIEPYVSDAIPLEQVESTSEPNASPQARPGGQSQIIPPDQSLTPERDLLLPDLITLTPTDLRIRTNQSDGHKLLRFTNSIMNTGPGGMELWGATNPGSGKMTVTQHIYDTDGSTAQKVVGEFFFHPEHNHWHLGDFARYEIWSIGPDGELDSVVAVSNKISYCLRDDARSDIPGAVTWQTYISCDHERQGISVGWIDIYRYHLPGQSIDITFLPDSVYALRSIVDPEDRLWDGNPTNNANILYIQIEDNSVNIVESPDSLLDGLNE
jgi:hypothetical protein